MQADMLPAQAGWVQHDRRLSQSRMKVFLSFSLGQHFKYHACSIAGAHTLRRSKCSKTSAIHHPMPVIHSRKSSPSHNKSESFLNFVIENPRNDPRAHLLKRCLTAFSGWIHPLTKEAESIALRRNASSICSFITKSTGASGAPRVLPSYPLPRLQKMIPQAMLKIKINKARHAEELLSCSKTGHSI